MCGAQRRHHQEGSTLGTAITSSETAFAHPAETVYDFVTNPANWTKSYPGAPHVNVAHELPLKVGDTWTESGPDGDRVYTWQLAIATRPRLWMFSSIGKLGHDPDGNGGLEGRFTIEYHFTQPGQNITLFKRTMTIESYRDSPLPEELFRHTNPANIDSYHAGVARQLAGNS